MLNVSACLLVAVLPVAQLDPLSHSMTLTQGLETPARVTITGDADLLVTDPQANSVVRFSLADPLQPYDPVGNPYAFAGSWAESAGPIGIAVHPSDGRIFVSRRDDAQVAVYDAGFVFQRFLGDGLVTFAKPTDIAVNSATGQIHVVDSGANVYYVFPSDESSVMGVGIRGDRSSEFKYPSAIAVDPIRDRVAVGDLDNFRIQLFDGAGVFQRSFGYRTKYTIDGGAEGWLPRTAGLAFDATGRVYVVDSAMGTLRIFTALGAELGKVIQFGPSGTGLQNPGGVAIGATGHAFIASSTAGTVEVYDPPAVAAAAAVGTYFLGSNESEYDLLARRRNGGRLSTAPDRGPDGASAKDLLMVDIPGWEPPHMFDDVSCGRCHDIDGQPGGHLGLLDGQVNLCLSCHTGAGAAVGALMRPTQNLGMSHAWGVGAVNATYGSAGPTPGGEVERYLDGGLIKCATCHNQHNNDAGEPFLRLEAEALCKDCHVDHTIHTPSGNWQPTCLDCHVGHDPDDINLSLISASVRNQTLGVDKPVVFTARSGPNSFDDGDSAVNDGICQVCHTQTNYHMHDGTGAPHNDGATCTDCHPHDAGFMPSGACDTCHGAPPATGAHLTHFGLNDVDLVAYGTTDNLSTPTAYGFLCGTCHPLSSMSHRNGTVDIELYNVAAPPDSLKGRNPPEASYVPGPIPMTDPHGIEYTLGTCSNIYCHSRTDWSSPDPISAPTGVDANGNLTYDPYTVTEFPVYAEVSWGDAGIGCKPCHRNMPQTSYPGVQAGVGNSHAWVDDFGYEDLHAWNMSGRFGPLVCRVCHYNTVTEDMTWTRDAFDITTFDDVPIADKTFHVNGTKDVAFDPVNPVVYNSTFSLVGTSYDPQTKLCSNVPCHLNQLTPEWGKPYRSWDSAECNQCHQMIAAGAAAAGDADGRGSTSSASPRHAAWADRDCLECHDGHRGM